jgi:hypothetical protein
VTTDRELERVRQRLPDDFEEFATVPFFLKQGRLIILGRARSQPVARRDETSGQQR